MPFHLAYHSEERKLLLNLVLLFFPGFEFFNFLYWSRCSKASMLTAMKHPLCCSTQIPTNPVGRPQLQAFSCSCLQLPHSSVCSFPGYPASGDSCMKPQPPAPTQYSSAGPPQFQSSCGIGSSFAAAAPQLGFSLCSAPPPLQMWVPE